MATTQDAPHIAYKTERRVVIVTPNPVTWGF
jgi:hypothetical protein